MQALVECPRLKVGARPARVAVCSFLSVSFPKASQSRFQAPSGRKGSLDQPPQGEPRILCCKIALPGADQKGRQGQERLGQNEESNVWFHVSMENTSPLSRRRGKMAHSPRQGVLRSALLRASRLNCTKKGAPETAAGVRRGSSAESLTGWQLGGCMHPCLQSSRLLRFRLTLVGGLDWFGI